MCVNKYSRFVFLKYIHKTVTSQDQIDEKSSAAGPIVDLGQATTRHNAAPGPGKHDLIQETGQKQFQSRINSWPGPGEFQTRTIGKEIIQQAKQAKQAQQAKLHS